MILIAASLSLLIIYAGTKLLMKARKEMLGRFFNFISWFIITGGFVLLFCSIFLICKKSCGHKHSGLYQSTGVETCDHTCVKTPLVDSAHFKARNAHGKGTCDLCTCCKENSVQGPWCCKKASGCCDVDDGLEKTDNGDIKTDFKDKRH